MWYLLLACTSTPPDTAQPEGAADTAPDTSAQAEDDTAPPDGEAWSELVEGLPTVIRLTWDQPWAGTVSVRYTQANGETDTTPQREVEAGTVEQIVLGATYGMTVEFEVLVEGLTGALYQGAIQTGERPEGLPVGTLLADVDEWQDGATDWILTSMNREGDTRYGQWWVFIMDRQGRVIWAQETPDDWISRHVSVAVDGGAMLVDRDTYWIKWDNGETSTIVRMTLDGQVHHTYATPGLHHSFVPLPDRALAWMAKDEDYYEHLEMVTEAGESAILWDCEELHEAADHGGTCGTNGLFWDEKTGHFLMSAYSTDTVAEIDPEAGALVRYFGDLDGAWTFDPEDSQFWWQHGPTFTEDRTLMVSTKSASSGSETMVREYALDEETETLHEVWSFGQGRGVYGQYMGEAHRLANGNTLHVYGAGGHMVEATPEGDVAWEMTWKGDQHNGHTTALSHEELYALLGER